MFDPITLVLHHGYIVISFFVFCEAIGLPVPASLALVAGGAASASHALRAPEALLFCVASMMAADTILYTLGDRTGWALLGFLCKVSVNPETCIMRSAESFYKRGRYALLFAKFVPGVNTMAPPLAGSMKMPFWQFLGLDFCGASLYVLAYGTVGYVFRDFIAAITRGFRTAGHVVAIVVIIAAVVFTIYRIRIYRKNRVFRVVPRVQVQELAKKLQSQDASHVLLVDVRSHGYYDPGAMRMKGSIRIEPNNLEQEIAKLPKDKDIYLYCT
ncbi:MAG TPA: VTT domain-containing protein [Candidatus Baltobacteraceae bacterium]|nr:VTT domain-containing protein [Candidatus Baltobacteraceae bacterium]